MSRSLQFQVEQDGEFVDATVVNVDEEANTRTVSFEVADFSEIMNAKVTVFVASANHTGNHTIRLAFDQDSVEPVATETPKLDQKHLNNQKKKYSFIQRYR